MSVPNFATKNTELSSRYAITTDLIYRLDMVTHRMGARSTRMALNAVFGDGHVRIQTDPMFFDTTWLWTSTMNGQSPTFGGIEDKGDNFRWLIQAFN